MAIGQNQSLARRIAAECNAGSRTFLRVSYSCGRDKEFMVFPYRNDELEYYLDGTDRSRIITKEEARELAKDVWHCKNLGAINSILRAIEEEKAEGSS
jgi:hypothetical protein